MMTASLGKQRVSFFQFTQMDVVRTLSFCAPRRGRWLAFWYPIKIAGKNINNLRYADETTLMAESEEELKSLLMKVKEESENFGLKLNIQETKIMTSDPITSWQIDGETVETMPDFNFGGSKITADGNCVMKLKDTYSLE